MRWGPALPTVRAPTSTPSAIPRRRLNQPAIAFSPLGYTPASVTPVSVRSPNASTRSFPSSVTSNALAVAPDRADHMKRRRAGTTSAMPSTADVSAPITNPT